MANDQYVYSRKRTRALNIGVRWPFSEDELLEASRSAFARRPDVLNLIDEWTSKHDINDARVISWGSVEELPWEMWVGTDGGDPDLDLVLREGWTLDSLEWDADDRACRIKSRGRLFCDQCGDELPEGEDPEIEECPCGGNYSVDDAEHADALTRGVAYDYYHPGNPS